VRTPVLDNSWASSGRTPVCFIAFRGGSVAVCMSSPSSIPQLDRVGLMSFARLMGIELEQGKEVSMATMKKKDGTKDCFLLDPPFFGCV
jgi:hypothetical protein